VDPKVRIHAVRDLAELQAEMGPSHSRSRKLPDEKAYLFWSVLFAVDLGLLSQVDLPAVFESEVCQQR